ncbi:hypothetical protein ABBQ32_002097 [Trebouxia sp. C0010 RCD-2024]
MSNRPSKGTNRRFSKGPDEASTARSGLRPTERILASQRTASVQLKLDDELQLLANGLEKLEGQGTDKEAVAQQLAAVQQQVEQVKGENEELRTFFQEALNEAEKLKHENEELRKLGEDAVLDQQLNKALQETDKLKLAADAYKKELLQQKVSELQTELAQTNKRLKAAEEQNTGLSQSVQGGTGGRRDSLRRSDKRGSQASHNGLPEGEPAASTSLQTSTGEREALLARLQGCEENRGDLDQLLAASAKALQDAVTLEAQLAEARVSNSRLQGEVEKLNDTVFSKTFRAPSAWAEREVKYKMEKKDWDAQVERLQGVITKLQAENVAYRDNNKTQQFEASIQELQQKLQQTEAGKVTAERALHELQLDMRSQVEKYNQLQEARRHQEAMSEDGVSSMIEGFDRQHIGGVQPRRTQAKPAPKQPGSQLVPDASSSSTTDQAKLGDAGPQAHVQDVVTDFDSQHIGHQQPQAAPHQDTDTHLHDQPPPDVTSPQPTSNYAATSSPVHLPPAHQQGIDPSHSSAAALESTEASTSGRQQHSDASQAPSSPTKQLFDQAGAAVLPEQPHSSSQEPMHPASAQQTLEQPSTSTPDPAAASNQRAMSMLPVDSASPPSPDISQQPNARQQPAIDARSETPSYTPADVEHTTQAAAFQSEDVSALPAQHQQVPGAHHTASTSSDPSTTDGEHVGNLSGRPSGPAEQTQAGTKQPPQASTGACDREELPAGAPKAAHTEEQLADTPAATASHSQQDTGAQQSSSDPAPDAASDSADPSQEPMGSTGAPADQPGDAAGAERGAGFPAGPVDDDSDMSESEDELLTVKDAVEHLVRSNRHSRANSSDKLDQLEPASMSSRGKSEPQPAAEVQPPPARVTFGDAGHIALPATSSLPNLATRRSQGGSRETNDMSGSATERSESSEAWSEERIRQLEEDKAAIERLWGEHAQENDIGVLKFKLAEFESRCEMYEAQVTKMQRSLERGDTEKAKVEEELAKAMALTAQGDRQGLAAMRDRLSMVVTGRASKTSQLEDRLKEAEEQLQQSFRERARLEKQRGQLERELASWSSTLGISIDISRAESVEASEPSGSDQDRRKLQRWQSSGSGIAGLNDGEMEVMRLREENEALMDSLVRTKVELAETEGEYLKTKRSLIRANEKLAGLSERVEQLKQALHKAGLNNGTESPSARSDTSTQPFGTPKSVQAGTPKAHM